MRSYPYGWNEAGKKWAEQLGWRYSPSARCLHWINIGRCGKSICDHGHRSRQWMDHVSGWTRYGGERLLLCQPYSLYDLASLIEACKQFNLTCNVMGNGWYGHGTVCIELRSKEQYKK